MSERHPKITTHRKGATIGVNRDGKPVGVVTDLGNRRFAITLYTAECPWDAHAGVATSETEGVATFGRRGETPNYMVNR